MPKKKYSYMTCLKPLMYLNTYITRPVSYVLKALSTGVVITFGLSACISTPLSQHPELSSSVNAEHVSESESAEEHSVVEEKRDLVVEANPDQLVLVTEAELAKDPSLPTEGLNAKTLEQLLLMSFASFEGDWNTAAVSALSAAEASQDFRVARSATLLALRNSNYLSAVDASTIWLNLKPASINAQNLNIISLVGAGDVEKAKLAIDSQIADQNIDDYIKQLAGLLIRQNNKTSGFDIAQYMVEQYPSSAQTQVSAAYVAQQFEQFEFAEKWAESALMLRPDWDLSAQVMANILNAQGKTDERAKFVTQFIVDNPKSIAMRINHASELGRNEKFSEAYELTLAVLNDDPGNVGALEYAAALAERLDNNELSAKHLRKALSTDPKNDDARWSLARLAVIDGDYATAERLFDQITDEAMYLRAQIQVANMRAETQGAELALNTLQVLQPRSEQEYLLVATTRHYILMGDYRYDDAFNYINEALVYVPDNLELLYARALVAAELERIDVVERDLGFIISQQPDNANALNALGYTLADQTDRLEEARDLIAQALAIEPEQAHILDSMGWVTYRLKDLPGAIILLQKAYEASPQAEIAAHLAEVLIESGQTEKASTVIKESYALDRDNPILNKVIERYGIDVDAEELS